MSKYTKEDLCNKVADIKYDVQEVLDALYSEDHELESMRQENANLKETLKIEVNHVHRLQREIYDLMDEVDRLRDDKERLTGLEIQLRDKIRELKKNS